MSPFPVIDRIADLAEAAEAAAAHLAGALEDAVSARGRTSFAATGGRTPAPVYAVLRRAPLDWARVTVTLSDERWVDEGSTDSNARLVRETLLTGPAAAAAFVPLKSDAPTPEAGAAEVEARLAALPWPLDAAMLGMGDDGHVASLFPHNPALAAAMALDNPRRCAAIPAGPNGLAPAQPRLSLTLAAILAARSVLVFVAGDDKWRVLQEALAGDDAAAMPVRAVLAGPAPVRVICAG
jgi:6-phosphogluconolactonase